MWHSQMRSGYPDTSKESQHLQNPPPELQKPSDNHDTDYNIIKNNTSLNTHFAEWDLKNHRTTTITFPTTTQLNS